MMDFKHHRLYLRVRFVNLRAGFAELVVDGDARITGIEKSRNGRGNSSCPSTSTGRVTETRWMDAVRILK
jgi:hypothetical protein